MIYKKILAAVDLSKEAHQVGLKAVEIAKANKATLCLINVIEPLSFAYGGDVPLDLSSIQSQLDEHASDRLSQFATELNYPVSNIHVVAGHVETEIHRISEEEDIDLIVVGSHGRHGLSLLLGSTVDGVMHGAKCDVLAVRVID